MIQYSVLPSACIATFLTAVQNYVARFPNPLARFPNLLSLEVGNLTRCISCSVILDCNAAEGTEVVFQKMS